MDTFKDDYKITSDFLSGSIGTNPVIIRKILAQLQGAGLITVAGGTGGVKPTRELPDISFYDVYQAIKPVEGKKLFRFHENPKEETEFEKTSDKRYFCRGIAEIGKA